jgi:hypothetical protein
MDEVPNFSLLKQMVAHTQTPLPLKSLSTEENSNANCQNPGNFFVICSESFVARVTKPATQFSLFVILYADLGRRRCSSYCFLTSTLDGIISVTPRPHLPAWKGIPVPILQNSGWAPVIFWMQRLEEEFFSLTGVRIPVVQLAGTLQWATWLRLSEYCEWLVYAFVSQQIVKKEGCKTE